MDTRIALCLYRAKTTAVPQAENEARRRVEGQNLSMGQLTATLHSQAAQVDTDPSNVFVHATSGIGHQSRCISCCCCGSGSGCHTEKLALSCNLAETASSELSVLQAAMEAHQLHPTERTSTQGWLLLAVYACDLST